MTSDPSTNALTPNYAQVYLSHENGKLQLILPNNVLLVGESEWQQFYQELKTCLHQSEFSWQKRQPIHLMVGDRLLDVRQLQDLAEILAEADLQLQWIHTSRRQTAVVAATAGYSVDQNLVLPALIPVEPDAQPLLANPLYIKTTVRSGVEIRHPGTIIVVGDINPGGEVIADGDIIIGGTLRGVAHAGAQGNAQCCIMALRMQPTQLRIADRVARSPSVEPEHWEAEMAYITAEGIRLAPAYNFGKTHQFDPEKQEWSEKG